MKFRFTILIYFGLTIQTTFAQNEIPQLEKLLLRTQHTKRVDVLNKLSWLYRNSDTKKAKDYADQAATYSSRLHYGRGLAYAWKNTGAIYSVTGNYPEAKSAFHKSLQQFADLRNHMETGNIWNLTGLIYWETGVYDSALYCYNQAFTLFSNIGDEEGKSIIYSNRAIIFYEQGDYDKALANNINALKIAEQDNNEFTQANIHTNIGIIYSAIGNYSKALQHHKIALALENRTGNESDAAKSYTNIGVACYNMGKLHKSLYYHQKALEHYTALNEQKGIAHSLLNIGSIYQEYHDHSTARNYFQQGLQLKRKIGDQHGEIIALTYLGRLYLKENKLTEARNYLELAYQQSSRLKLLFYQAETSLMLAQIADMTRNPDQAVHYYKIYTSANNRLQQAQSSKQLTELQIGLATTEKQKLIDRLEKQSRQSHTRQWFLWTGSVTVVVLLVLLFVRFEKKYRNEKNKLEEELNEKRAQLFGFTNQMIRKNGESATILPNRHLQTDYLPDNERLETLHQLSNARLITEDDWETFKKLFHNVYPFFLIRIRQRNPNLTQAELRLSTLTLLNLTTREIAGILGISPESVKKARQRLRKKLDLSANESLEDQLKLMTCQEE